ncbi:MAG TPA: hypothetical protein VMU71_10190 [Terracidiphilus sp.]|nr:hypothetical protein [Terracidiphilus sp.]
MVANLVRPGRQLGLRACGFRGDGVGQHGFGKGIGGAHGAGIGEGALRTHTGGHHNHFCGGSGGRLDVGVNAPAAAGHDAHDGGRGGAAENGTHDP